MNELHVTITKFWTVMAENLGDEDALQHFNRSKRSVMQNRLLAVSSINLMTFLLSIFSISYYRWVWVEIVNLSSTKSEPNDTSNQVWANLLYGKQQENPSYQSFHDLSQEFCPSNDAGCQALFIEFAFVGYLVFFLFIIAYLLQLLDFYQVIRYIISSKIDSQQSIKFQHSLEIKDSFKHIVTILIYSIGLGLNFFSLSIMKVQQFEYGVSFWIFFSSLLVFIACVVYKNYEVKRIQQQSLVLNLIEAERNCRNDQTPQQKDTGSGQFEI